MKKIFQTIVDAGKGNCMQAAIASLFDKELNEVPDFKAVDDWFHPMWNFVIANGYEYTGMLYNKKMSIINNPTCNCFKDDVWAEETMLTKENLNLYGSVNGFFYATVLSPKYFNWGEGFTKRHAVVIDLEMNVVHDPNKAYQSILRYPMSDVIDCNGIVDVMLFEKIETKLNF